MPGSILNKHGILILDPEVIAPLTSSKTALSPQSSQDSPGFTHCPKVPPYLLGPSNWPGLSNNRNCQMYHLGVV